ncbi:hypothetical protein BDY19DRAFT_971027 [Irpex rosettiformis]|uniref:Uncharacterized protein n=1 Tax=Irpex rosettiformis TaxID=378272 RepID=A0ACB8TRU3_9APHY|nr:hypothetical protein BDY19DRAFT_971027 [Irpex rosettiformis]
MQNPREEIAGVVSLLTATDNPETQKAAVARYYAVDVAFKHPLCEVSSSPGSRDQLLGILQWYRVLSPTIKIQTNQVTYDEEKAQLFLDISQEFHIRWSPFRAAPARLLVHLSLRPSVDDPNLLVISRHEDFYHPDDFSTLLLPPLTPLVKALLHMGTLASNVNARIFGLLGYWNANNTKIQQLRPPTESEKSHA